MLELLYSYIYISMLDNHYIYMTHYKPLESIYSYIYTIIFIYHIFRSLLTIGAGGTPRIKIGSEIGSIGRRNPHPRWSDCPPAICTWKSVLEHHLVDHPMKIMVNSG
jgi:hypothetical protein